MEKKKCVYITSQKQWDFVTKKLNLSWVNNWFKVENLKECYVTVGIPNYCNRFISLSSVNSFNYKILSFQEWLDENNYTFEEAKTFEVDKWYMFSNAVYLKFASIKGDKFICSERIVDRIHSIVKTGYRISPIVKVSVLEYDIQNFLPEGHPDKIKVEEKSWCVKLTEENKEVVSSWMSEVDSTYRIDIGNYANSKEDNKYYSWNIYKDRYKELSTEEFYQKIGHVKKMSNEELIAEAKRRYPVGCKINQSPAYKDCDCSEFVINSDKVSVDDKITYINVAIDGKGVFNTQDNIWAL